MTKIRSTAGAISAIVASVAAWWSATVRWSPWSRAWIASRNRAAKAAKGLASDSGSGSKSRTAPSALRSFMRARAAAMNFFWAASLARNAFMVGSPLLLSNSWKVGTTRTPFACAASVILAAVGPV